MYANGLKYIIEADKQGYLVRRETAPGKYVKATMLPREVREALEKARAEVLTQS